MGSVVVMARRLPVGRFFLALFERGAPAMGISGRLNQVLASAQSTRSDYQRADGIICACAAMFLFFHILFTMSLQLTDEVCDTSQNYL